METRNILIGVGVLAIGGFLAWKFLKKPTITPKVEESTNENEVVSPKKTLETKVGGSTPVKGFVTNVNKSPFVSASLMKSMTIRLPNGDVVNLKKGDKVSVANNYGEDAMTYIEGNTSQKLKWDVDVYFPRTAKGVGSTSISSGGAPQFDGNQNKRHNFPYFY